jgi:hypothetical protein
MIGIGEFLCLVLGDTFKGLLMSRGMGQRRPIHVRSGGMKASLLHS